MTTDPILRVSVVSSNLVSIGYDAPTRTLAVEFKGGAVYHYGDVPVELFDALMGAESKGRLLHVMKTAFDEKTGQPLYPVKKMASGTYPGEKDTIRHG